MRFNSLRAAAKARRRFVTDYDPQRGYIYRVTRMRRPLTMDHWFEVDIYSSTGTFLAIL
ncbi:hypothetical protein [Methylobacterium sp.]|uniref:hypothetical protein n=1 Tax=Methylobacterium sp. TaxID=409 RepID=UPI00257D7BAB|nr:hypothetical protein [Methylobacterium sp.]